MKFVALRAFPSSVSNAKYLTFGTPNTKNKQYQKVLAFATVESLFWNGMKGNAIWFLLFFIHLSLSSQIKYLFLFSLWVIRSLLHPFHSHRLFCSSLFPFAFFSFHSWAITNFLSTISQIPSSLIYKISFTILSLSLSLSPLCSISYIKATWFGLIHLKAKTLLFCLASQFMGLYFSVVDSI